MKVAEKMRGPVQRVTASERSDLAARRMRDFGIGFLAVVDEHGKLAGVVTDRDLAVRVLAERRSWKTPVGEVMSVDGLVTCWPDEELEMAEARMARHKVSRIVVTDRQAVPVGVISLSDIADTAVGDGAAVLHAVASREIYPLDPR